MLGDGEREKEKLILETVSKKENEAVISRLKKGRNSGVDSTTAEMLKSGGDAVVDWVHKICAI